MFFFQQKTAYEMRISDWSSDGVLFRSQVAATGIHRQATGERNAPVADEARRLSLPTMPEALERKGHVAGKAVIDLQRVHVLRPETRHRIRGLRRRPLRRAIELDEARLQRRRAASEGLGREGGGEKEGND